MWPFAENRTSWSILSQFRAYCSGLPRLAGLRCCVYACPGRGIVSRASLSSLGPSPWVLRIAGSLFGACWYPGSPGFSGAAWTWSGGLGGLAGWSRLVDWPCWLIQLGFAGIQLQADVIFVMTQVSLSILPFQLYCICFGREGESVASMSERVNE